MDLGNTIKEIRKQKGIKQNAFADLCNISQTYLSQIENNLKEPNISILREISARLQVSLPILFFLSLNDDDIPQSKRDVFQIIGPTVKTLIKELITDE
ncbi:MAG: helix-turn-helix transcriptional regulator [Bacteroidota bacterium]